MRPKATRFLQWWPIAVLVLSVVLVVAAGGFSRRSDLTVPAALGQELDCRDLVFTFERATAQHVVSSYAAPYWEVVVLGTVRNPHDESLTPISGDYGHFSFRDPRTREIFGWDGQRLLDDDPNRTYVPPGNSVLNLSLISQFPEHYRPGTELDMGVNRMEYTDNVVFGLGGGRKNWNIDSASSSWVVNLPVTVLPERHS
ncbi:MAG: hypothetical protein K4304_09955 [Propionicimonas sp.]